MLQIAICEDERNDREKLERSLTEILNRYGIEYQITSFFCGEALLASDIDFHLIFMDIVLAGKNGIEIGRKIYAGNQSVKIIYQTNFKSYCQEAVNTVHAFAFLEKPLTEAALSEQIEEFLEHNRKEQLSLAFQKVTFVENGILIKKPVVHIPVDAIYYFEYLKSRKKVKIVTAHNIYEYRDTMRNLESRLHFCGFETSCRGILVNLMNVAKIKDYKVYIRNGETVALSQKRAVRFKERLNECINAGE